MNDNANGAAHALDDEELSTTVPNPPPAEWKMPEPIFRKTSGRLPQGFEKELANARAEHAAADPAPPSQVSPAVTVPSDADPAPKSSSVKLILVILGVAAMIGFIAVFLTVVYFFFFRGES